MSRAGRIFVGLPGAALISFLVWDQIESRALARAIAEIAARGEPTSVADQSFGADTPERRDAAGYYARAAEYVRSMPQELTFRLPRLDVDATAGPPIDRADLERTYRPDAPALQLLDLATPLDFNGFGDVAPDLNESTLSTVNALAALRADLYSLRGDGDAAARALIPCVRLARTVTSFNRFVVFNRVLGSVRILLRHTAPRESALAALQQAVAALPDGDDLAREVLVRRARYLDEIETPPEGFAETALHHALHPWITRAQRRQLATFEEAQEIARAAWPQKLVTAKALEQKYADSFRRLSRRTVFDRLMPPAGLGVMSIAVTPAAVALASRRLIPVALAVERYRRAHAGALPASLDVLAPAYLAAVPQDPFSGTALVYRPDSDGYTVYSVDVNQADDNGALYGLGSQRQLSPRSGEPRDLGIRVDLKH